MFFGARDRNRTGTGLLPRDFKSRASASSATRAPQNMFILAYSFRHVNLFLKKLREIFSQKQQEIQKRPGPDTKPCFTHKSHRPAYIEIGGDFYADDTGIQSEKSRAIRKKMGVRQKSRLL